MWVAALVEGTLPELRLQGGFRCRVCFWVKDSGLLGLRVSFSVFRVRNPRSESSV